MVRKASFDGLTGVRPAWSSYAGSSANQPISNRDGTGFADGPPMPDHSSRSLILVLSAMPSENKIIREALQSPKEGKVAIFPYLEGRIGSFRVITAVTGVGVTNGAMCTALFLEAFKPAAVLVSGTGSRFNPDVRCGDVILSKRTIHHAAGSLTSNGMVYRKVRGPLPGMMTHYAYAPDRQLFREAKRIAKTYRAASFRVDGLHYRPEVYPGVVSASDLFGVDQAKIDDMRAKLNPDLMEMESAAIAQVCNHLGYPHHVFRAGSNRTQADPGNDYRKYGQKAAASAARWTVHYLHELKL